MTSWKELITEVETVPRCPDPLDLLAVVSGEPWPVLLHSSQVDPSIGRYSILAWDPFLRFEFCSGKGALRSLEIEESWAGEPFSRLRQALNRFRVPAIPGVPFVGGAIGFLGYGLKNCLHPLPSPKGKDDPLPDLSLAFYAHGLVLDHLDGCLHLVATGWPEEGAARRAQKRKLDLEKLRKVVATPPPREESFPAIPGGNLRFETSRQDYLNSILEIQGRLEAGEIYQANLSHRIEIEGKWASLPLYRALAKKHPACFSAFLPCAGSSILCASPERLVSLKGDRAETRPIKGTCRREPDPISDDRARHRLTEGVKERSENVMIVDLARNDLGRVCRPGTVKTEEICKLESLPSVHHLVSTISGRLRADKDGVDLVAALFPGGSMTGAPKIRAMEIIEEMEPSARGIYSGSIGYFSFDGNLDLNIVIRTLVISGRHAHLQVGGAILVESKPDLEYEETLDKARPILDLLIGSEAG